MSNKYNALSPASREVLKGFFVLEGIDGSGTTTQLRRLESRAKEQSFSLRADCEPTGHPIGKFIRRVLRHEVNADPRVLAPLFAADRRQHLDGSHGVREALNSGQVVVSDRYWFSSMAYQSLDLPWDEVWQMNAMFPFPEALFWLDTPVEEAQDRIAGRGQPRERFEDRESQDRVAQGYGRVLAQSEDQGLEIIRLDGRCSIENLTDSIWARICR